MQNGAAVEDKETKELREELKSALERVNGHQAAGRFTEAAKMLDELITKHGDHAKLLHYKGLNLLQSGEKEAGEKLMNEALEKSPEDAVQLADVGAYLAQSGRMDEAIEKFQAAVEIAPNYAVARGNLGAAMVVRNRYQPAIAHLRKAIELEPQLIDAQNNLAVALIETGQHQEAIDILYRALAINPHSAAGHVQLARALFQSERYESAEHHARRALEIAPNAIQAYLHLGDTLSASGKRDEAAAAYRSALDRRPRMIGALQRLIHMRRVEPDSPDLKRLRDALTMADKLGVQQKMTLHFAAGKAFDDLGQYDNAFGAYKIGNDLAKEQFEYNVEANEKRSTRIRQVADAAFVERFGDAGLKDVAPIFICGLPRSGTTLMEQMFSRHSQVQAGGELGAFNQAIANTPIKDVLAEEKDSTDLNDDDIKRIGEVYVAAVRTEGIASKVFTDKMPANYYNIGLIRAALPEAKIVLMRRHPLDCLLSNYFQNFGRNQRFSSDFGMLAGVYREFRAMCDHWKSVVPDFVMEVNYEDVVADPEGQMKQILDHCGLEWEPDVMDYASSMRPVRTASISQVREEIYDSSVQRWRNYGDHVKPLAEALGSYLPVEDRATFGL